MNVKRGTEYILPYEEGRIMGDVKKRPAIPKPVERELWVKSGGRCEFRGCNKYLYKDGVTRQPRNLANIAHIVSWIPTGPRGNQDSEKLAKDISNLMLTCSEHNNLIDDAQYVEQYPIELLQQFKREHEERIFRVTGMGQDYGVRIIKMYSKIQNQVSNISNKAVSEAIMPYYPLETDINIDLTQVEDVDTAKKQIERTIDLHVLSNEKEESYCLFIMAKIPYTCYLGYILGNKVKSETFQFFRDKQDWKWREGQFGHFAIIKPTETNIQSNVNLLVEVSGKIDLTLIPKNLTYSVQADNTGFLFLQSREQVVEFQIKFRELLDEIREKHGEDVVIHLIVAAPNPITFEIGKSIMKNIDPTILLYDKVENTMEYKPVMYLHERIRE